jgi:steroid 5-alpha reductase family enzyme
MSPTLISAAAQSLTAVLGLALLLWIASLRLRDASIADRFWPVFIALAGLIFAWQGSTELDLRLQLMLAVTLAWALRLALFITWRNWGHGEDRRYAAMRQRHGPGFARRSLTLVFGLQALLAWVVATPLLVAAGGAEGSRLGLLDLFGLALALGGLVTEAVADAQMARFRRDPAHYGRSRGDVMDAGLWRYSRHPNYFGEACVWWGQGLMAVAASSQPAAAAAALLSPLLMTGLLLKVSGVALLEQDLAQRRPAYRDYMRRTPAFFPGLPKV